MNNMNKALLGLAVAGLMACGDDTTASKSATSSDAVETFKTQCEAGGGTVAVSDNCAGHNSCEGFDADGTATTCAGTASCAGAVWCEQPEA